MTSACIQCSAEFSIAPEEVTWYAETFGEGALPKRCKECRKLNKRASRKKRMQALKETNKRLLAEITTVKKELEGKKYVSG